MYKVVTMSWLNKDEIAKSKSIAKQNRKYRKKLKRDFQQACCRFTPIIKRLLRDVGDVCFGKKLFFLPYYTIKSCLEVRDNRANWSLEGPGGWGPLLCFVVAEWKVEIEFTEYYSFTEYSLKISAERKELPGICHHSEIFREYCKFSDIPDEDTLEEYIKKILRPLSEKLATCYIYDK